MVTQQVVNGLSGIASYAPGQLVQGSASGSPVVKLISVKTSGGNYAGLSLGLGVSDLLVWSTGIQFEIVVNGFVKLIIMDEICTLLQKEFFPFNLPKNALVEINAKNLSANDVNVSAFMRLESI